MQPFNQGPGPGPQPPMPQPPMQPGPGQPGPGQPGPMQPGPMQPGFAPMPPRKPLDLRRIASAVTAVAGIVVLFCSLLNLYSITVDPGSVDDSVSGTVEVGMGFYTIVPFNAPVVALAIPLLMLVAAVTALPGVLGRAQGSLVSAVSALTATFLALVLMVSNPLPGVELSGALEADAASELSDLGVDSVDDLVGKVVNIGPGAGLIIAFVFGIVGAAAAGFAYWRGGPDEPKHLPGDVAFVNPGMPVGYAPMPVPGAPAPTGAHAAPAPDQGWTPAPPTAGFEQPGFEQPPSQPFDQTQISPQPPTGPAGTP